MNFKIEEKHVIRFKKKNIKLTPVHTGSVTKRRKKEIQEITEKEPISRLSESKMSP